MCALINFTQGPFDVGNAILGKPGVMEMLVAMADSGDLIHTVIIVVIEFLPDSH
jgi:hypothetical protein